MATYNYILPHWANGQKAVHDAPNWVVATIEGMLADRKGSRKDGLIRIQADYGVGLRVAWIQCPVSLRVDGGVGAYRTAQYVHAIARDVDDPEPLTRDLARRLLERVYGEPIQTLIDEQQRYLEVLEFPAGLEVASSLFIGKQHLEAVRAAIEADAVDEHEERRAVPRGFGQPGPSAEMSREYSAEIDEALEKLRQQAWSGRRPSERVEARPSMYRRDLGRPTTRPSLFEPNARKPARLSWIRQHRTGLVLGAAFVVAVCALALGFLR